jgi:hypothetical protein
VNGYVEAGYLVIFGSLGTYGVALLGRERAARRRVLGPAGAGSTGAGSTGAGAASFTDSGGSTAQVGDGPTAKPQHAPLATEEPEPAPGAMS